ncbi:MAG: 1-acyl-sn-glycerol-3-phosphate acyltransferase [Clostridia bacterium]|nr:1-acyl-sn-glycerol-3-phosphate acyltransferase [Clostridia bacterium]
MNHLNFFQRWKIPLNELEQYYIKVREERFNNGTTFRGIKFRKMLHPILLCGLYIMHILNTQKITIVGDDRIKNGRPIIYAATHIGWDDIEMILTAVKDHAYLFWGDPRESYRQFEGFLLDLNGAICVDLYSKSDRFIGKESCIKCLELGENILIFPEGAWNLTESTPVMNLFSGVSEIAIRSKADVVPVAIEQYGKHFFVNIGKNINFSDFALTEKEQVTEMIRQKMGELKWNIWASKSSEKRDTVPKDYREKYIENINEQMKGILSVADVEEQRFHTKFERETEAIKKDLENLKPNKNNAFLFDKRLV